MWCVVINVELLWNGYLLYVYGFVDMLCQDGYVLLLLMCGVVEIFVVVMFDVLMNGEVDCYV